MNCVEKMVLVPFEEAERTRTQNTEVINKEMIVGIVPKNYRNKARHLLSYIEKDIAWNDKGEVVYRGETMEGTHIADLVRYSLKEYGKQPPKGFREFSEYLETMNVPESLRNGQPSQPPSKKRAAWENL